MQGLSSPSRDQASPSPLEAWSVNHWTARQVPWCLWFLKLPRRAHPLASVEDQCLELEAQEGSFLFEVGLGCVCLVEAAPPFQFMRPWATPMLQPSFANGLFASRAKMVTVPELWATPPEVKEKIHLLYQKSEFVEKRVKHFLGRWACRMGGAPSPAFKTHVAWTPWCPFSIFLVLSDSAFRPHLQTITQISKCCLPPAPTPPLGDHFPTLCDPEARICLSIFLSPVAEMSRMLAVKVLRVLFFSFPKYCSN